MTLELHGYFSTPLSNSVFMDLQYECEPHLYYLPQF